MIRTLAICGPTASGKTALSVALAKRLDAEIISLDSMQVYRGMDIGTAKATPDERDGIPHHLIDVAEPSESYSTERYRREAEAALADIHARGRSAIFVGGTGLYLDTLTRREMSEVPAADTGYRDRVLEGIRTDADRHALWERLNSVDPESAEAIHENNVRRVIRALEIYEKTGKPKSLFDRLSKEGASADIDVIVLTPRTREALYDRIDKRVDEMMERGLLSEVRSLCESGALPEESTASQAIGYKELMAYLRGDTTLECAAELIKQSSRRYAKRQLTWFRHVDGRHEIYLDRESGEIRPFEEILNEALDLVKKINNIEESCNEG